MSANAKKTSIGAAIAFVVACSICFLPAIVAAVAAGGLLSTGGILGNGWLLSAGVLAIALAAALAGWLVARRQAGTGVC